MAMSTSAAAAAMRTSAVLVPWPMASARRRQRIGAVVGRPPGRALRRRAASDLLLRAGDEVERLRGEGEADAALLQPAHQRQVERLLAVHVDVVVRVAHAVDHL